jgi:hypothetical protein
MTNANETTPAERVALALVISHTYMTNVANETMPAERVAHALKRLLLLIP